MNMLSPVKGQWMDIGLHGSMVHVRPTLRCQRGVPVEKVGRCKHGSAWAESMEGNIVVEETPITSNAQQMNVQVCKPI